MRQQLYLYNPIQAHKAINHVIWPWVKSMTTAGNQLVLTVGSKEEDRTLAQNRFYWGPCLGDISEQASIAGIKYSKEAWHELFKRQHLGFEVDKVRVAGKGIRVIRRLRSTSKLKVKAMGEYLEKVQAFAATELGVQFTVLDWPSYSRMHIDTETGEILQGV